MKNTENRINGKGDTLIRKQKKKGSDFMKIYIAGKITGDENYYEKFLKAELRLEHDGHTVINPARLPLGLKPMEYMHICFAMIEIADAVCLLPDFEDSLGASLEALYAGEKKKKIIYYAKYSKESDGNGRRGHRHEKVYHRT